MKKKKSTVWFSISFVFLIAFILSVAALEKVPIRVCYVILDTIILAISYITCCYAMKLFNKGE